jgi:NAD+ synthase
MSRVRYSFVQETVRESLGVSRMFDATVEIERRLCFLAGQLRSTGTAGYVLGVSGGVDSCTAGRLCQLSIEGLRDEGYEAHFIAVRLPYRKQQDEADAQRALEFIRPDETVCVDVAPATDAVVHALAAAGLSLETRSDAELVRGNVKARQRMVVQYAIANARNMLVVGTDHAAEAVTGFFTKHGDGGCDLVPLYGLTKRRIRAVARALGVPERIVDKTPTADLDSDRPGLADEEALDLTYREIDAFLEGEPVSAETVERLLSRYRTTAHKRQQPTAPRC